LAESGAVRRSRQQQQQQQPKHWLMLMLWHPQQLAQRTACVPAGRLASRSLSC